MEPKWPRITPLLALLSDGYPTVIRRRALVDTQFWGPRPKYPTVIRRLSDGHPTVIRRLCDGHPTVIRRLSDGNPKLVCSPKVQQKTSPKPPATARAREGPRGPKHELGASGSRVSILFVVCGCHAFCAVGFFLGLSLACLVGLLLFASNFLLPLSWRSCFFCHWPAWSGCCFSDFLLLVCLLCLPFFFWCSWIFSGPVTGLCGCCIFSRSCLFCTAAALFRACHWPAWLIFPESF